MVNKQTKLCRVATMVGAGCASWLAASISLGAVTPVDVERLFAPDGFDDNDDVQFVLDGHLQSSCFQALSPKAVVDSEALTIKVTQPALFEQGHCLTARVPFTTVVQVGQLAAGEYTISYGKDGKHEQKVVIGSAIRPGPDDFHYAPVANVYVPEDSGLHAIISGEFTNSCMSIGKTEILDQGETIVIKPILDRVDQSACQEGDRTYRMKVDLPKKARGRYLLHVRSLNGQAVNEVYSVLSEGDGVDQTTGL